MFVACFELFQLLLFLQNLGKVHAVQLSGTAEGPVMPRGCDKYHVPPSKVQTFVLGFTTLKVFWRSSLCRISIRAITTDSSASGTFTSSFCPF